MAVVACVVAFCLAVFYVLLSAPLLLYAARHPGSSAAEMVDVYVQPLIWADDALAPEIEWDSSEPVPDTEIIPVGSHPSLLREEPIHRKILFRYYDLWDPFLSLEYMLHGELSLLPEPDPFYHYP